MSLCPSFPFGRGGSEGGERGMGSTIAGGGYGGLGLGFGLEKIGLFCGKTSLLFQFAFNSALQSDSKVVFICKRRKLETKPPYLSQGINPSSDIFQRIQMKYVGDEQGINKYFAAFHLFDKFPHTVIMDDFGDLFEDRNCQERYNNYRGRDIAMVQILALCHNAIIHANE